MINGVLAKEGIALADSLDFEYVIRKQYLSNIIICKAYANESEARFNIFTLARLYAEANLGAANMGLFVLPKYLMINQPYLFSPQMLDYIDQKQYPGKPINTVSNQSFTAGLLV